MHTDSTAVTIQCKKIVLNEVRQLNTTRAIVQKKQNELFGQPNNTLPYLLGVADC